MKARVVVERQGSHRLLQAGGTWTLEVLVGTSALYAVRLVLTPDEVARFEAQGAPWLDALAADVARREAHYRALGRTTPV